MKVLVINCGSSSLKYQLIDSESERVLAKGLCERIGIDGRLTHKPTDKEKVVIEKAMPTHTVAIRMVLDELIDEKNGVISGLEEIGAVGHRIVHGGEKFASATLIDEEVMKAIEACSDLAPLHNPANLIGIRACKELMPEVPMVGVFDTAFHQTMPPQAYMYALPYKYYEKYGVRRYGFHGTSHSYVSKRTAEILGKDIKDLNIIVCHLGNGSSICAVQGGKSIDTSMGLTPLEGVPMGTRCGDIDPAIIEFIAEKENLSLKEVLQVLNKESGVQGISGISSDFRDLEVKADEGDERAALAQRVFSYNVAKYIGGYAAAMGRVDAVVFTAGVGENDAVIRSMICENLKILGIQLDKKLNRSVRGVETILSTSESTTIAMLVPTNEELAIARETVALVK